MTDKNSIRLLWRQGDSVAEIARKTGVSRDTVYKYRDMDDFSPEPPARRAQGSKLDPYRPLIESRLDDDMRSGRKQRHTAKRVHDRLVSECGADVSVSTVERCVREIRARRSAEAADAQYLDLVWGPGEAQADFGEADFYVRGMRTTLSFFVMTFPYSNVGLAQVFPGVNVNPSFTDSTNAIAPIAPTHPRRFRRRQAPFPASRSGARSFVR